MLPPQRTLLRGDDCEEILALTGMTLRATDAAIEELVDRHLLEESAPGRFRMHDPVRDFDREPANQTDYAGDLHSAARGLLDHYLHVAAVVTEPLEVKSMRFQFVVGEPLRSELLAGIAPVSRAWLEAERWNLPAMVDLALAPN